MASMHYTTVLLAIATFASLCCAVPVRVVFEKCDTKGFTCANSATVAGKVDITFRCNTNTTTQDIQFYLWAFSSPGTITTITLEYCERIQLSLTCSGDNRPIQRLTVRHVKYLEFMQPIVTHNPPQMIFEDIGRIDTLPRNTFTQLKKEFYKPNCFNAVADLEGIFFKDVKIGTVETEAFRNLSEIRNFTWHNVTAEKVSLNAVDLTFLRGAGAELKDCDLGIVEPMAFRVTGNRLSVTRSHFCDIWGNGFNGTVSVFEFSNNTVGNVQSSGLSILAETVSLEINDFRKIETGAFQKIGPGLLHDSLKNLGKLDFTYKFTNNLVQEVNDYGIRPDYEAYKHVASETHYHQNILQCSSERLSWMGADADLGDGYSVLHSFNTILHNQGNNGTTPAHAAPCMCFGVKAPYSTSSRKHFVEDS